MQKSKWFKMVANIEELKSIHQKLAMRYHPDKGGSVELMYEISKEYEMWLSYFALYTISRWQD